MGMVRKDTLVRPHTRGVQRQVPRMSSVIPFGAQRLAVSKFLDYRTSSLARSRQPVVDNRRQHEYNIYVLLSRLFSANFLPLLFLGTSPRATVTG